jgi:hypothetical protein
VGGNDGPADHPSAFGGEGETPGEFVGEVAEDVAEKQDAFDVGASDGQGP